MKVFELTEADTKTDFVKFAKKLVQKGQSIKAEPSGTPSSKLDGKDGDLMKPVAGNRMPLEAVTSEITSGAAKLSKDIDAELGKRGADPLQMHQSIFGLIQEAAREYARAFNKANGITKKAALMNIKKAQLTIRVAAYGYINKKYLGGSADNFSGNTKELIAKALQSQAPKGGNQPIGKVSSSRAPGAQGTVPSGGGTNALDTIASQDF